MSMWDALPAACMRVARGAWSSNLALRVTATTRRRLQTEEATWSGGVSAYRGPGIS